ncbi:MAG: PLD nuclease N-terminal domain-containing protein [Actinomycetota bacterium]|nr:PLD nuclease N-terminal domain-containing protein [Actinomycetota bacterium]
MYRSGTKLIWILVIVFTQVIGAIIYLVIGRPERDAKPPAVVPPPPPPPRI